MFCVLGQIYLTRLSKVALLVLHKHKKPLVARSPAGSPGETAGKAAAAVGEEVRPSANGKVHGILTAQCTCDLVHPRKVKHRPNQPVAVLLSQCDVGEQCAVRKGARIGKMCDCPRGAFCNFYLLKCL